MRWKMKDMHLFIVAFPKKLGATCLKVRNGFRFQLIVLNIFFILLLLNMVRKVLPYLPMQYGLFGMPINKQKHEGITFSYASLTFTSP